jgi:hypothetical protein
VSNLRTTWVLALCAASLVGGRCGAAETRAEEPKYALQRPSDLTPEQQDRILKAFIAAERPLQTFVKYFPGATFSMVHPTTDEPQIIVASTLEFGRYSISLVYSGTFSAGFAKLLKSRCDLFGAYDNNHELGPKERRKSLRLAPADMERFCGEPLEYLEKVFAAARQ